MKRSSRMNIFENCPSLENDDFKIRLIEPVDAEDLLEVYSDKYALPFFNSDNCHGSNFYITNKIDMDNTIKYWLVEYHDYKGFVRFSILNKKNSKCIGTIEMFHRKADDFYNDCGLLRMDLGSKDETATVLTSVLSLIIEPFYDWFHCKKIATKAPIYAVERIEALKRVGFEKKEEPLIGHDKTYYYDYWIIEKKN